MNNIKPALIYIGAGLALLLVTLFLFDGASWQGFTGGGVQFAGVPWVTLVVGLLYAGFGARLIALLKIKG